MFLKLAFGFIPVICWPGRILVENKIVIKFYFFKYNAIIIFCLLYVKEGFILSVLS